MYMYGRALLSSLCGTREVIAPKTVNVVLVCNQGLQHYCGIVSICLHCLHSISSVIDTHRIRPLGRAKDLNEKMLLFYHSQ